MKKRGRFSVEEVQFIEQNCEALSPQAIADQLDRDVLGEAEKRSGGSSRAKTEALL
jgi:hypothetical protein